MRVLINCMEHSTSWEDSSRSLVKTFLAFCRARRLIIICSETSYWSVDLYSQPDESNPYPHFLFKIFSTLSSSLSLCFSCCFIRSGFPTNIFRASIIYLMLATCRAQFRLPERKTSAFRCEQRWNRSFTLNTRHENLRSRIVFHKFIIILVLFGEESKLWSSSLCSFLHQNSLSLFKIRTSPHVLQVLCWHLRFLSVSVSTVFIM
jgi:hypothetical protein